MTKDLALKQALAWISAQPRGWMTDGFKEVIADIEQALAQQAQEPAAWQWLGSAQFRKKIPKNGDKTAWNPLYTTPPQRTWVGLTADKIEDIEQKIYTQTIMKSQPQAVYLFKFAKAIEAELKKENT